MRHSTREYETTGKGMLFGGTVEVSGRWVRATLECPSEPPDADIVHAWRAVGEDGTIVDVPASALTDAESGELIDQALERDEFRDSPYER